MIFKRSLLYLLLIKKQQSMDQTTGKQSTSRRSKEQTLELLSEYDKDHGTTVKAFCKLHQISEGSFYSARSRYRPAGNSKQQSSGFIAIGSPAFKEPANTLFAEVKGIKLYQAVPANYLKALIV
jgi:hypothetical protein